MRSPVLVFSLVAAAATTVSASGGLSDLPLSPHVKGHAPTKVETPRQYVEGAYPRPQDANREIAAEHRDRQDTSRLDHPRPPQPNISAEEGKFGIPAAAGSMAGGVSDSSPAVGADAEEGGSSASSAGGNPASGTDILHFGNVTNNLLDGANSQDAVPARSNGGSGDHYMNNLNAYSYNRMKRIVRTEPRNIMNRRDDFGLPPLSMDEPDDENSGQDGPDGVSQRGRETPGSGPYGGEAHSGEVGSSEGGHVYNEPASDSP
ncbi:hypothetical protein C8Q70DRAFT_573026 [Cubamyces menziesii]|nr:hypothetical protein C8Q70DRAFT_573026 [Cubamyces menziesii]